MEAREAAKARKDSEKQKRLVARDLGCREKEATVVEA
jgi:hypothetical protein